MYCQNENSNLSVLLILAVKQKSLLSKTVPLFRAKPLLANLKLEFPLSFFNVLVSCLSKVKRLSNTNTPNNFQLGVSYEILVHSSKFAFKKYTSLLLKHSISFPRSNKRYFFNLTRRSPASFPVVSRYRCRSEFAISRIAALNHVIVIYVSVNR